MKRLASVLSFLICLSVLPASAQWYLFPGKNNKRQDQKKEVVTPPIRQAPDTTVSAPVGLMPEEEISEESVATVTKGDDFILDIPEVINVSLLLPLKSSIRPSRNFYEFYTGALMAASDLGDEGYKIVLNVFDTEDEDDRIPDSVLEDSHVIIGPVKSSEIGAMLTRCRENQFIISPLEQKSLTLADSGNVIQIPVSPERQTDDLIEWMKEEKDLTDAFFLLADSGNHHEAESQARYLEKKIEESGISFTIIPSSSVEGLQLAPRNAFVIASDDDKFLCDAVNNISRLTDLDESTTSVLYGQSRLRSLDGISSENLFKLNSRLTSNYYVDYSDSKVKDFILRFRSVFNSEPSAFAYHGYDTMHYFISLVGTYGKDWRKKLSQSSSSGLQADFKFEENGKKGAENCAVRRVRYHQDLSTSLQ